MAVRDRPSVEPDGLPELSRRVLQTGAEKDRDALDRTVGPRRERPRAVTGAPRCAYPIKCRSDCPVAGTYPAGPAAPRSYARHRAGAESVLTAVAKHFIQSLLDSEVSRSLRAPALPVSLDIHQLCSKARAAKGEPTQPKVVIP